MKILLSPYAQKMRNNMPNPKTYPYWGEVVEELGENNFIQIGVPNESLIVKDFRVNLPLQEIRELIYKCDTWISVDSFLPHFAHHLQKPGIVIFSLSDPLIFGYPENMNLLKDRSYLRPNQFEIWEVQSFIADAFVSPEIVVDAIKSVL